MTRPVLVLRPQPGADHTAARAADIGLRAIVAPLFRIVPRPWAPPEKSSDALLLTSANAARMLDDRLDRASRIYAVGEATAAAAREAGFDVARTGEAGVAELISQAVADGVRSMLHLAGADRTSFDPRGMRIETQIVYAAEPCEMSAALADALNAKAVALLHSARAARRFRELAGARHRIAAISPAVLAAAGAGWEERVAAAHPTDDALLAAAARLCNEERDEHRL